MFNFLHPRPVVDGRAVAVQIVQQKVSARQETRTLIVTTEVENRAAGSGGVTRPAAKE
ncbi:MAG: hypothetical protein ACRYGO_12805 [Janthinobacterium lividum]